MTTYLAEVQADTPAAFYRQGEASGTTMVDSSGNGRDGTFNNTPTLGVAGAITGDADTAITYTAASSQDGRTAYASWLDIGSGLAVECWVKTSATGTSQLVVSRNNTTTNVWHLGVLATTGLAQFFIRNTAGSTVQSTVSVADGVWHHLVGVYNGTTAILYVDGVPVASTAATSAGLSTTASQGINVGSRGNLFLNGSADEVAYYSAALTTARIARHYSVGAGKSVYRIFSKGFTGTTSIVTSYANGYTPAVGDLLLIFCSAAKASSGQPSFTTPTNWTLLGSATVNNGAVNGSGFLIARFADGTANDNAPTITVGSASWQAVIQGWYGLDSTATLPRHPASIPLAAGGNTSTTNIAGNSITTSVDNEWVWSGFASRGPVGMSSFAWTDAGSGPTPTVDVALAGPATNDYLATAQETVPTSGTVVQPKATFSIGSGAANTLMSFGFTPLIMPVGTLAATLDDTTLTGTAAETFAGTLSATLDDVALDSQGVETVAGTLTVALDDSALLAGGTETLTGTLAATLDDAILTAAAEQTITGTLAATLDDATLDATGDVTSTGISGTFAATLDDTVLAAVGVESIEGAADATLDDATLSSSGGEAITGTLSATLDDATLVGSSDEVVTGTMVVTLDDIGMAATGAEAISGTISITLVDTTIAASGVETITGTAAVTLDDATLDALAEETSIGILAATLDDTELEAAGDVDTSHIRDITVTASLDAGRWTADVGAGPATTLEQRWTTTLEAT